MPAPDVTVLGAGVAGLACAIACRLRGRSVEVVEQAEALTEIGAGLQIAPNGGRVLDALGVAPPFVAGEAVHIIDGVSGRSVIRMPVGPGFRMMHRADLIAGLAAWAEDVGVSIRLGCKVAHVGEEGRSLILADGTTISVRHLIGADGVRGAARAFVAPDHRARFTGQVAWRAVVPVSGAPAEAQIHTGPGRHLVCYPLRDRTLLNIVAVEERSAWTADGWSREDEPARLREAFSMFAPSIRELLDGVERTHLWGLMDHGATARWSRGGCTLIGDAAHPTLPFLAQGANLALEDAWTVAAMLEDREAWEAGRRGRVERALDAAKANAGRYHMEGGRRVVAQGGLRMLGRVAPAAPLLGYRWLYDMDVTR